MRIETTTRRANFWLFVGLVVFAIVLCASILLWMRARTHAQGGKVYPPVGAVMVRRPLLRAVRLEWPLPMPRKTPVEIVPASPLVSLSPKSVLL